jgi:hypothetical protein
LAPATLEFLIEPPRLNLPASQVDYGQGGFVFGVPGLGLPRGGGHSLQLGFVFDGEHVLPWLALLLAARATMADMENTTNNTAVDMVFNPFSFIAELLCS